MLKNDCETYYRKVNIPIAISELFTDSQEEEGRDMLSTFPCVPVTSDIYRISTKIEIQKIKLVPSLYGLGESYKQTLFFI